MWRRLAFLFAAACVAFAAEKPVLEHLYPSGLQRGTANSFTLFGKFDPWPPRAWSSSSSLAFSFSTNKGQVQISVPADAAAGPCFLRFYNDEGASDPAIFVIGSGPEIEETEPNNHFRKAQALSKLPVTINGRLEKNGDVDSFAIAIHAGDWLDAHVDCYTLMGKVDPVLRLLDTDGHQLAWNHDFASLDPRLIWRARQSRTVVLQIFGFVYPASSEIALSGGAGGVYRLHLSRQPAPPADISMESTEREPNNTSTNALEISAGQEIFGTICPRGDEDRFRIALKKDEFIEANVDAATMGSALDAWLKIEDAAGKELARNDDADNSRDPRLEWKAPSDGNYFLAIGSLTHQGSEECRYRLGVRRLQPDFRAVAAVNSVTLAPGSTNELKFNLKRLRGFTNELQAVLEKLPEGVALAKATIPAGEGGEGTLQLTAAANAPAFNGPVTLLLVDKTTQQKRVVPFQLVSRTENNGVPGGYTTLLLENLDQLWLTVKSPDKAAPPR